MQPSGSELQVGDIVETTLSTSEPNVGYPHSPRWVLVIGTCDCADVLRGAVFPVGETDIILHRNKSTLVYREPLS